MISDYSIYKLNKKEQYAFYMVGYVCLFAVAYLFYHSLLLAALCGVLVHFLKPLVEGKLAERRRQQLNAQFKDLLYSLSASIAAGRQMSEALIEAESSLSVIYKEDDLLMIELRHMKRNIVENKESDKVLLLDFAHRCKSEDISNFVHVYVVCRAMGGNLEKVISHTAQIITEKMAIEREIRVITNQKKTEGRIISVMPFAMLLVMNLFSYSYIYPLYSCVLGRIIMTGALICIFAAIILMEKMSAIEV